MSSVSNVAGHPGHDDKLKFEREDGADGARLSIPMVRGRYRFNDDVEPMGG
jgi:hypothetical protein